MSAKLYKCVAARRLVIARKAGITGEVAVRFKNVEIKPILISSNQPIDLFGNFKNIKQDDILNSNILELIAQGMITIIG
jgi:hypothetical protein